MDVFTIRANPGRVAPPICPDLVSDRDTRRKRCIFNVGEEIWRLGEPAVDKTVARLNIEHFRKLLANEADKTKRQLIARLLAEEEAKLARLEKQNKNRNTLR